MKKKRSTGRIYRGKTAAERQRQQRQQLMAAGLEIIGTEGYRALTIRKLSQVAQLTDRYFYANFENTEAFLIALYEETLDSLEAKLVRATLGDIASGQFDEVIRKGLRVFYETMEDHRIARLCFVEVLGVSPKVDAVYVARNRRINDLVESTIRNLSPTLSVSDEELRCFGAGATGILVQLVRQAVLEDMNVSTNSLVSATHKLLRASYLAAVTPPSE